MQGGCHTNCGNLARAEQSLLEPMTSAFTQPESLALTGPRKAQGSSWRKTLGTLNSAQVFYLETAGV